MRIKQCAQIGIRVGPAAGVAGGAKRRNARLAQPQLASPLKELHILGVGARPAAFNVRYSQLVKALRNTQFVGA